jgi:hypothetical protein
VSFDVTSIVTDLVNAQDPFVGLTVRAGSLGGLMVEEGAGFPKLTIETMIEPSAVEQTDPQATLFFGRNVPNHFTVLTRIECSVPDESRSPMASTIHDATGRLVCTLQGALSAQALTPNDSDPIRIGGRDPMGKQAKKGALMEKVMKAKKLCMPLSGLGILLLVWAVWLPSGQSHASPPVREVALTFGPGGVLTNDGALWQYRLDTQDWVTIDQAFKDQGQNTKILPLPVSVDQIESMESFGFFVTRSGDCWLYDLEEDAWKNIATPSGR